MENDDDLKVGHDQTIEIKNNRTEVVKDGNEKVTIEKGKREIFVDKGNDLHQVKMGNRSAIIDMGNESLTVKMGNQTTKIRSRQERDRGDAVDRVEGWAKQYQDRPDGHHAQRHDDQVSKRRS